MQTHYILVYVCCVGIGGQQRPLTVEQLAPNLLVRNLIARYVEEKERELGTEEETLPTDTYATDTADAQQTSDMLDSATNASNNNNIIESEPILTVCFIYVFVLSLEKTSVI